MTSFNHMTRHNLAPSPPNAGGEDSQPIKAEIYPPSVVPASYTPVVFISGRRVDTDKLIALVDELKEIIATEGGSLVGVNPASSVDVGNGFSTIDGNAYGVSNVRVASSTTEIPVHSPRFVAAPTASPARQALDAIIAFDKDALSSAWRRFRS